MTATAHRSPVRDSARPGCQGRSLARTATDRSLGRAAQTIGVSARHLAPLLPSIVRRTLTPAQLSAALAATFQELGGTYVKLGQLAASAPGIVGEDVADGFRGLLDAAPAVPFVEVRRLVEEELGLPLEVAFAEFDPEPLAAASIATVHRAALPGGRAVAVKVLRPGIEQVLARDVTILRAVTTELATTVGTFQARAAVELVSGLEEQLVQEIDLTLELAAMDEARRVLDELGETLLVVPAPVPERSTRRVLTMELLDGAGAIDDLGAIEQMGLDVEPIILALVRAWFGSALRYGTFHGDVHAGNLLALEDGRIGILDWGVVGRLDEDMHRHFRLILAGALGDESAWEPAAENMLAHMLTPAQRDELGITAADLVPMVKLRIGGMLTKPFNELNLSELLDGPPLPIDDERPTAAVMLRRFARNRFGRSADDPDESVAFDRNMFLLVKQLAYFERYGRLYLGNLPLVHDPEQFRPFLASEPDRSADIEV